MSYQLKKRLTALALAVCLTLSCTGCRAFAAAAEDPTQAFSDIGQHWSRPAIRFCLENGYMAGVGDGLFHPNGTVTRAQVVQVLYTMAGSPSVAGMDCPFVDIGRHWARRAIFWAYNNGIVSGIGANHFSPNAAVIREQLALMLQSYRAYSLGEPIQTDGDYLARFTDRQLVSSWAADAVNWAVQAGLMSGTRPDTLSPKGTCTRAQLAQVVKSYYEPAEPPAPIDPPSEEGGDGSGSGPAAPETGQSNSPLVSYTRMSPNHSGRRSHSIDTISIHCMAEDWTVEQCGESFADPKRQASSNYGIGSDGRIALYVDERNRSWCTSSAENDNRAVTIEVANIGFAPDWPVSNQAYSALIDLVTDICWRNGIKRLLWQGDKELIGQVDKQNMTVHRWFSSKSCPGNYLYSRHGDIAAQVNKRLAALETAAVLNQAAALPITAQAQPQPMPPLRLRSERSRI